MGKIRNTILRSVAFVSSATLATFFGLFISNKDRSAHGIFTIAHADTPTGGSSGGDSVSVGCDSCCGASNGGGDPGSNCNGATCNDGTSCGPGGDAGCSCDGGP